MKKVSMQKVRARVATEIIVAIIGAVAVISAAIIGYGAATYQSRHDDSKIKAGSTAELKFGKSKNVISQTFNLYPSSGTLAISAKQTSGKEDKKNGYSFEYKNSKDTTYNPIVTLYFNYNGTYSGEYTAGKVKRKQKYDAKVSKIAGYEKKSSLSVDWLVK